jgi:hypothetical protein
MILLLTILLSTILCGVVVAVVPRAPVSVVRRIARAIRLPRRDRHASLPPDWWDQFGADFRAYASSAWRAARKAEQRAMIRPMLCAIGRERSLS